MKKLQNYKSYMFYSGKTSEVLKHRVLSFLGSIFIVASVAFVAFSDVSNYERSADD